MSDNPKKLYGDKKPPLGLIPPPAILELGVRMGEGARKYGPYNWREKGVNSMTYVAAINRHLMAYLDGEDIDPECPYGSSHMSAIMACAAILIDCGARGNLIDDRPPSGPTAENIRYFQEHGKLPGV